MYQKCQKDALRILQYKVDKSKSFELDINLFGKYQYETTEHAQNNNF